jgi:hypothetical protein
MMVAFSSVSGRVASELEDHMAWPREPNFDDAPQLWQSRLPKAGGPRVTLLPEGQEIYFSGEAPAVA